MKWGLVCRENELQNDFFRYPIVERGYSDKTKSACQENMEDFFSFFKESGNEDFLAIDHRDVRVYLSFWMAQLQSHSISRKMASLRSFYHF